MYIYIYIYIWGVTHREMGRHEGVVPRAHGHHQSLGCVRAARSRCADRIRILSSGDVAVNRGGLALAPCIYLSIDRFIQVDSG